MSFRTLVVKCIIAFLVITIFGCKSNWLNTKFDKEKWRDGDIEIYPYRDGMLDDLLSNYHIKGITYKQLTILLGEPRRWENTNIDSPYYDIKVDYGNDIDPVYSKTLTIYLNKDSIVTNYKVKEWQNN